MAPPRDHRQVDMDLVHPRRHGEEGESCGQPAAEEDERWDVPFYRPFLVGLRFGGEEVGVGVGGEADKGAEDEEDEGREADDADEGGG